MEPILRGQIWILCPKGTLLCRGILVPRSKPVLAHLGRSCRNWSIQRRWRQSKGDFEAFCRKVGWTTKDGEVERKKRWFGASEFIYDVKKAPEGHLPLTSALRGTSLLKNLLTHPVFDNDDWKKEP